MSRDPFTEPQGRGVSVPPVLPDDLRPELEAEILQYVREELARFGRAGDPFVRAGRVELRCGQEWTSASLGDWAVRWHLLDEPTRRLRTAQIARSLSPIRRSGAPRQTARWPRALSWLGLAAGVAAVGWYWQSDSPGQSGAVQRSAAAPLSVETTSLRARGPSPREVCDRTLARVVRGATVTGADSEGWVVVYMAFREDAVPPLAAHPGLNRFLSKTASNQIVLTWSEEPELLRHAAAGATPDARSGGDARGDVRLQPLLLPLAEGSALSGIELQLGGALASGYFTQRSRAAYFHLAAALSEEVGARYAGLFARCRGGPTHHIGSWFSGPSHEQATAALVYLMGTYANPVHLDPAPTLPSKEALPSDGALPSHGALPSDGARPFNGEPPAEGNLDRAAAFSRIRHVTSAIDRPLLTTLVDRQGGLVMGKPGDRVTITFPFSDSNRASRMSREIARATGLAP